VVRHIVIAPLGLRLVSSSRALKFAQEPLLERTVTWMLPPWLWPDTSSLYSCYSCELKVSLTLGAERLASMQERTTR